MAQASPDLMAQHRMTQRPRILVIKHGALGDFVLATGPFKAIRTQHPQAHITLLTTTPFVGLGGASGLFDAIWVDDKPKAWAVPRWLALRRRLRLGGFIRVYDLQTSARSSSYFRLFRAPRPEWSGIAAGCSHPHTNPQRDTMHTIERQAEQLADAGIDTVPLPDVAWLDAPLDHFALPPRFVLMVPGGAAHRLEKRWPASAYAELATTLAAQGLVPVLLGSSAEDHVLAQIGDACSEARNLCGQTGFAEIAALARGAVGAVGNDTGPMHLIAVAGCSSLVLFSAASNPDITAPRGPDVGILQDARLDALPVSRVHGALRLR